MVNHLKGTREEWLAARLRLLEKEKALTKLNDELARERQELPWVKVDKEYRFETGDGNVLLLDLFKGRSQLLIYHFMFGPEYAEGCPCCSAIADGFQGIVPHLTNHDVMLWVVSRAPLSKLEAYKRRMGWTFPWASSFGSDFNYDYTVSITKMQQNTGSIEYNYRKECGVEVGQERREEKDPEAEMAKMSGTDILSFTRERPGMSAFIREDGVVYHTYSAYARGLDSLWGMYQWFDRAPKGRNENSAWLRRRDEYDQE